MDGVRLQWWQGGSWVVRGGVVLEVRVVCLQERRSCLLRAVEGRIFFTLGVLIPVIFLFSRLLLGF